MKEAPLGPHELVWAFESTLHHARAWAETSIPVYIQHDDIVWTSGPFLKPDFYREDHRLIFRAIQELNHKGRPCDAVTVTEWFESHGLVDQIDGGGYISQLASNTPSAANVRAYAEIVRERSILRQLVDVGAEITSGAFSSAAGVVCSSAIDISLLLLYLGLTGTHGTAHVSAHCPGIRGARPADLPRKQTPVPARGR